MEVRDASKYRDLQKAFDTVDHDILCRKLRAMGVESVEWFRSYLADRTQIMKLHRYIDHDWQMTPIDFQVTRFKAKNCTEKDIRYL
ncbi:hypothetical protein DPMN_121089 [Dreissena polymorpha]|uniref:Uncharacterized protein n=1 Tax=Dreissena polymorpha TaxID=45954 RepID=A0A9D4GPW0_DREPO|nr:hypothetical protein DPMN_121089 [Dreissena polymorpha]